MCHPLKDVEAINNRLNVVDHLAAQPELMLLIAQSLRKLPDLERLLGRVKSSVQSSVSLLMPSIGNKLLKRLVSFQFTSLCFLSASISDGFHLVDFDDCLAHSSSEGVFLFVHTT